MTFRRALAIAVLGCTATLAVGQISLDPPNPEGNAATTAPAAAPTPTPPANDKPGTAATLPSAESVLNNLLREKPPTAPPLNTSTPGNTNVVQHAEAAAPNEPATTRLREGQSIYNRIGRLVKDDKTGNMLFVFDGDGKNMYDPPMAVIPCRYLAVMEDASENGTKPIKFKISAEVTQYRGKNYLYIKFVTTVRDLNQGLGG